MVAEYLLHLADKANTPLDVMQLVKMVYISHGWMLGFYQTPLFNDRIEAWTYGPVVVSVQDRYKKFEGRKILSKGECNVPLNENEKRVDQRSA